MDWECEKVISDIANQVCGLRVRYMTIPEDQRHLLKMRPEDFDSLLGTLDPIDAKL